MIAKLLNMLRRKPRYLYRSSVTGRYVSQAYAEANPATTVAERVA